MDLKKMGLEELSYKEATDIDGGGLIEGLTEAVTGILPVLKAVKTYLAAVVTEFRPIILNFLHPRS